MRSTIRTALFVAVLAIFGLASYGRGDAAAAPAQQRLAQAQGGESVGDLVSRIKRHIEPCWRLPAGARENGNPVVEIRASLSPDGRIRTATIVDTARTRVDGYYRSLAESAVRALLNPRCQPLPLPPNRYKEWRDMLFVFDLQELY